MIVYEDLSIERIKSEEPEKKKFLKIDINASEPPAIFIDDGKFELTTTEKKYSLKCEKDSKKWCDAINTRFSELKKNF